MNAIEQRVLEMIGENTDSPDVFTEGTGLQPIRDSISDAMAEIVMLTGSYKRQYFVPLQQDKFAYRIKPQSGSFGWVTDAFLLTQRRRMEQTDILRLTKYNPRWMVTTGSPEAYFPIGNDIIGVYPKPGGDFDQLELTVVEIPGKLKYSHDRIKLKLQFQYAVVHYAVSEFWASRGDANEAKNHMDLYMQSMGLTHTYGTFNDDSAHFATRKAPWPTATS